MKKRALFIPLLVLALAACSNKSTPTPQASEASALHVAENSSPRLSLAAFNWAVDGHRYRVNRYLEMSVSRAITFVLQPRLFRMESREKGNLSLPPLGMKLKARFAFVSSSKGGVLFSSEEAEAQVDERGQLVVRVTLANDLSDEILVRNRLWAVVELSASGDASITKTVGIAPLTGLGRAITNSATFVRPELPFESYLRLGTAKPGLQEASPIDLVVLAATDGNARRVSLPTDGDKSVADLGWKAKEVTAFLSAREYQDDAKSARLALSLCGILQGEEREKCKAQPLAYFSLNALEAVSQIEGDPVLSAPLPNQRLQIYAVFYRDNVGSSRRTIVGTSDQESHEEGTVNRTGTAERGGDQGRKGGWAEYEGGYKIFGNGASAKFYGAAEHFGGSEWIDGTERHSSTIQKKIEYIAVEQGRSIDDKDRIGLNRYGSLKVESWEMTITATLDSCLLVSASPKIESLKEFKSRIICVKIPHARRMEQWYYVTDEVPADDIMAAERAWTRVVRGEKAFAAFARVLEDRARRYVARDRVPLDEPIGSVIDQAYVRAVALREAADKGAFPGVLDAFTRPERRVAEPSPGPKKPSFWSEQEIAKVSKRCSDRAVLEGADEKQAAIYCRCLYDEIASRCTYKAYYGAPATWLEAIEKDGTEARCSELARGKQ